MIFRLSAVRLCKNVTVRKIKNNCKSSPKNIEVNIKCPEITHGDVFRDRKSSFQGHAARVKSIEDVIAVITLLMQNKKIHDATHNMLAYRIERASNSSVTVLEGCDDDGEALAGGRLLRLLRLLDQRDTVVVVTRWYGGVKLGTDRFRHIHDSARDALFKAGLIH